MRKEPPLTAKSVSKVSSKALLENDVFASDEAERAKEVQEHAKKAQEAKNPTASLPDLTDLQLQSLIEQGGLHADLPGNFDACAKAEMSDLVAMQRDRTRLQESADTQSGLAVVLGTLAGGWVGYQLSDGSLSVMFATGLFSLFGSYATSNHVFGNSVPIDDLAERYPHAHFEQRIAAALVPLNSESKVLRRAQADGFIQQRWIDNLHAKRRIEKDISRARSDLDYSSRQQAREQREGRGPSAAAAANMADAQARLSIATAELTGALSWHLPNLQKCKQRYEIDRFGRLRKDLGTSHAGSKT